jgi:chemotaxis protein histidine kinase CheA
MPNTTSFDAGAIQRAEAALKALSINFQEWMSTEVEKLEVARVHTRLAQYSSASLEALYNAAHDVKGLGTTYEYPFITTIAGQLCRLLESADGRKAARETPSLIDTHVDAIRAVLRGNIRNEEDATVGALVEALKARVDRWARP